MFFQGFLIGLVAGVWLAAIYLVVTTRGQFIRSYFNGPGNPAAHTGPVPQPVGASPPTPKKDPQKTHSRPTPAKQRVTTPRRVRLDPARLSPHGAASFRYLTLLVHDDQTAQRLVQSEAGRHPHANIDELIDIAVAKVLHDRR